ncbi:MAG: hypothetical protein GWN58_33995 [Anaerolineae bacterium]|nr:hypothetical protein [Thermoplasmata archaeon]NIV34292.1 hypothetical protein [Anaerolineae bacterium]NIY06141.1 hypothetical protein [Thermoplasmata archaeon]
MFDLSGTVSAKVQDARGYTDEDFKAAIHEGTIRELLASLPVDLETGEGPNQILYPLNAKFFYHYMGGDDPGYRVIYDGYYFCRAYLSTDTSQSAWTDAQDQGYRTWNSEYNTAHPGSGNTSRYLAATPNAVGLVEEARITEENNTPTGLRAIHLTNTWLWLPSDAVTSDIRGLRINTIDSTSVASTSGHYQNSAMQHRFVDSGGTPITIAKNANQTFCARWTQTFKSI